MHYLLLSFIACHTVISRTANVTAVLIEEENQYLSYGIAKHLRGDLEANRQCSSSDSNQIIRVM